MNAFIFLNFLILSVMNMKGYSVFNVRGYKNCHFFYKTVYVTISKHEVINTIRFIRTSGEHHNDHIHSELNLEV